VNFYMDIARLANLRMWNSYLALEQVRRDIRQEAAA
jgi:hypothetical protein